MDKFIKLPNKLKSWKINSVVSDTEGNRTYKVSKKDYDGSIINGILRHVYIRDEQYNEEKVDYILEEADFLQGVSEAGNKFNYLDIYVNDSPSKEKADFYIVTEDLPLLSEKMKNKEFSEAEIIDFGIQISKILESLEAKNIYHGNISPENIYITNDGTYKLGGFSDFEGKISDLSYIAPEIYAKKDADFTTDIYSLGLIMYRMCNNGRLPFEKDNVSEEEAIKKRFTSADVEAPANGSRELKSIIMIACKPKNKYRWKNASNIINALSSIRVDSAASGNNTAPNVIVPEKTDFDGDVFEEYDYEGFEEVQPTENASEVADIEAVSEQEADAEIESVNDNDVESAETQNDGNNEEIACSQEAAEHFDNVSESGISEEETDTYKENIDEESVGSEVFDSYEAKGKNQLVADSGDKDYGEYFDDEPAFNRAEAKKDNENTNNSDYLVTGYNDDDNYSVFDESGNTPEEPFDNSSDVSEEGNKKNKKSIIAIVISVIVILAALGFIAYCVLNGVIGKPQTETTAETTTAPTEATTVAPTTNQPTTAQVTTEPTTVAVDATVTPVVGYGYSYAKELLEEAGFTVEIGDWEYSYYYPEGYVIGQTPDGDTSAEKGSVVTLDISLGLIEEEETQAPEESSNESSSSAENSNTATSNTFIFPNSDSAYLSKADVEALSQSDLTIAINEIYARRGRIFTSPDLAEYFNSQSWYTPKYTAEEFDKAVEFNEYEQANLQLLVNYR